MFLYSCNMTGNGAELLEATSRCDARIADEPPIISGKNEIDFGRPLIKASVHSKQRWRGAMLVGSGPRNEKTEIAPIQDWRKHRH